MKFFLCCILLSSMTSGCLTTFSSTKVGPNRFAVSSQGHDYGPENYSKLLKQAYDTCTAAGYKDYTITSAGQEPRRVIILVTCEDEVKSSAPAINEEKKNENTFLADLTKIYSDAKKKLEEHTRETTNKISQ